MPRQIEVAEEVGRIIDEGKTVWAVGCTHVLALARRDNWLRYGFFFRGTDRYMSYRFGDPFVPYKDGELPDVILLSRGKLRGLETWLPRFYERESDPEYFQHSIAFWKKRDEPLEFADRHSYSSLRTPGRKLKRKPFDPFHSK